MRFALSAVAATSGLVLLALAYFGEPANYLRQARSQWDSVVETKPLEPVAPHDDVPAAATLRALQEEVSRLKDRLAENEAAIARTPPEAVPPQASPPSAQTAEASAPPVPTPPAPAPQPPTPTAPTAPSRVALAAPANGDAEKRDVPDEPATRRHEAARAPPAPRTVVARSEPPAPRQEPPSPRQEADDTRSVLARLRQAPPEQERPQPPAVPTSPASAPPSPALSRLAAARSALAKGRIDDARRQLQQAQLLLVFRPVGSDDGDAAAASIGANDVAHALEALSGNDLAGGRRFVERALDDMSGKPSRPSEQSPPPSQAAGYAPAYPPR